MHNATFRPPRRAWLALCWLLAALLSPALATAAEAPPKALSPYVESTTFWGNARDAVAGYTTAQGPEAGVLINDAGHAWRLARGGYVSQTGLWTLGLSVGGIALFFLVRGRIRLDQGRCGETIERWTLANRILHWYVAVLFLVLMFTGLALLFGKYALAPVFGKEAFAALASVGKTLHNYTGPLFAIGVVLLVVLWLKDNLPTRTDLRWFRRGGGIVGHDHPSAGFLNGGEKLWYWIVIVAGIAVSATGLVLDFPNFGQWRETMQFAHIIHVLTAVALMAGFFGHLYIATLGVEGALEGMTRGHVDVNWAKQHHDLWYEEIRSK